MDTSDFDYDLPPGRIAQRPAVPRDAARLMAYDRASGRLAHHVFSDLPELLRPGDVLVVNDTRVFPARLPMKKAASGGKAELLLLHKLDPTTWEALAGGKGLRPGTELQAAAGPAATILRDLGGARRLVAFEEPIEPFLAQIGQVPVPPYIHQVPEDPEDYQTVFAEPTGSAAAPTAGLHFTRALLARLQAGGIPAVALTLHIGLDTFAPVLEARPEDHVIHSEWCHISPEAAARLNQARAAGGRVVAVGTTAVRALETAARATGGAPGVAPYTGSTNLYILPGHEFRVVDALITNFHLPRSTLLALVSAFAGREQVLSLYHTAISKGYRFYSFGDAMLFT
ncbi:MAG: tRNA preQ1(34) S-adenosylmethionine ribosyltransferase-isomerase QueA [Anaerolineales bacterium]|nr:tRNA preQ1(34) S-adenosylmethionine ribosyltransferase-isomerase QueA [Anaerolineales bacterium]